MHKEIDNMNRLMTLKEIESIINIFSKNAASPDGFTGEFFKIFKEAIPIFSEPLQKIQKKANNS